MDRIDFSNNGGFPLDQDALDFLQNNFKAPLNAIAQLFGDKSILYGVEVVGGNVTPGWISYNGELILFQGGAVGAQVVITETPTQITFEDGAQHDAYFVKVAKCGALGDFPFSDLKVAGIVPKGLISMWSGAIIDIPRGWALCDGTNGTPNLSGKFIVGYDATDEDYNAPGKTGGAKSVILTKAQLPAFGLKILNPFGGTDPYYVNDTSGGGTKNSLKGDNDNGGGSGYITTENLGSSQGHENRPPYYTLAYIIKL